MECKNTKKEESNPMKQLTLQAALMMVKHPSPAVSGDQGPTTFSLKGTLKPHGFTGNFLEKNGAALGLTLVMIENAYMMEVAWEMMTPLLVKGI
jgi:hypothetical protein